MPVMLSGLELEGKDGQRMYVKVRLLTRTN